jgi:phospholipid/cholesterol/gamma-HCH transport system substrate-binding protein
VDGIDVGKVDSVALSGSQKPDRVVKVIMTVRRERLASIPADSFAQISSDSLIGDKFVDVTSGKNPRRLSSEDEMIYKDQPELLKTLDLAQFTRQLRLLDATLTDIEQGRSQFGKFVQGDEFYRDLITKMSDLHRAIREAVSTTSTVGGLLSSDRLHQQLIDFLAGLDQAVARIQSGQGAARPLRDSAQYEQLLGSVREFRNSVQQLRGNELLRSDAAYTGLSQGLAALIRSVDEINANPMLNTTVAYEDLNGTLSQLRDTIRDFRLNPRKYLRLKVF